jgi:hypothetical protein
MSWLSGFDEYTRDMFRDWVGKMTGVLSILLAIAPLVSPAFFSGDAGLWRTRWFWWGAAIVSFFIASRLAWDEQRRKRDEAEQKLAAAESKYFDERPQLDLVAWSVEGRDEWSKHQEPLHLSIRTLGGRIARDIRFDRLESKRGNFRLEFDSISAIAGQSDQKAIRYEFYEVTGRPLPAADLAFLKRFDGIMLCLFMEDASFEEMQIIEYPMTVRFMDGEDERSYTFCLRFDPHRFVFLGNTAATL